MVKPMAKILSMTILASVPLPRKYQWYRINMVGLASCLTHVNNAHWSLKS